MSDHSRREAARLAQTGSADEFLVVLRDRLRTSENPEYLIIGTNDRDHREGLTVRDWFRGRFHLVRDASQSSSDGVVLVTLCDTQWKASELSFEPGGGSGRYLAWSQWWPHTRCHRCNKTLERTDTLRLRNAQIEAIRVAEFRGLPRRDEDDPAKLPDKDG